MQSLKILIVLSCVILSVMSRKRSHRRNRWGDGATKADISCAKEQFRIVGNLLYGSCKNTSGANIATGIDMSRCLQNKDGKLSAGGAYQETCNTMVYNPSTGLLVGQCKKLDGSFVEASIEFGVAFGNNNGCLIC